MRWTVDNAHGGPGGTLLDVAEQTVLDAGDGELAAHVANLVTLA